MRLSSRFSLARWAPIPLRLIVGYGFMEHGFSKLSKGTDAFAATLQAIGVPAPHIGSLGFAVKCPNILWS
jgi:putative oxidoreductase